jgi:hypothetical protein
MAWKTTLCMSEPEATQFVELIKGAQQGDDVKMIKIAGQDEPAH